VLKETAPAVRAAGSAAISQEAIEVLDYSTAPPARPPAPPPTGPPPIGPPPTGLPPTGLPPGPSSVPAERSRLGGLAVSATALALGVLGLLDLSGISIRGGFYLAVPLALVGTALVIGAFVGRARWLIAPGIVLALFLGVATTVNDVNEANGSVTWRPAGAEQLERSYTIDVGNATLDLSAVDFSGQRHAVSVGVDLGDLTVIVPAAVDVRVDARVDVGTAEVFGSTWDGIGQPARVVEDDGADGPGGGTLLLAATVDVGNLEVRR
jgi:hypothetical protein